MDPDQDRRRLVASYGGEDSARVMADRLADRGVAVDEVSVDAVHDLAVVGRGEQRREARHASVGLPLAIGRADQHALSGWFWSAVGFSVGFVPFFLLGLFTTLGDLPRLGSAAVVGICGGLGGAAVGVVYGLARGPELSGSGRDAPRTSVLSVPANALGDEAALLELLGSGPAASVWAVRGEGAVVDERLTAPTSDHPGAVPDAHDERSPHGPAA
ncbi:hypothetical protein [Dermatobacter hominis]|uniref:hypothetical protein n=1 Tax=Dermatobacter hominis TaxID=2884263 RepID=UPI001D122DBB|nr:hypothetical protein [Dermatobacter hominis]UDY37540.1 hypothetical protein LH044_08365 [Dermatobacter hominis]